MVTGGKRQRQGGAKFSFEQVRLRKADENNIARFHGFS
jgi:hypothetical protein